MKPGVIARMGGRTNRLHTGRYFEGARETRIEPMEASSEAHDSGRCAASAPTHAPFGASLTFRTS